MKKLADGVEVEPRDYYFLLDWRDSHSAQFSLLTNQESLNQLTIEQFNYLFDKVIQGDLTVLKTKERESERSNNRTD